MAFNNKEKEISIFNLQITKPTKVGGPRLKTNVDKVSQRIKLNVKKKIKKVRLCQTDLIIVHIKRKTIVGQA